MRAPGGGGDDQRADRLVEHGEAMFMPLITVAMPSRIWVPKAAWMAIEARRSSGFTRRAKITSAATTTQAHQRWRKWMQEGIVGQREAARPATSRCRPGTSLPCISGQSLAT